ncbi:MAG: UvrD-helicase domain-containing protein [Rubripirellula sp.]
MPETNFLADVGPIDTDNPVDSGIQKCLDEKTKESFITFAGAGSGKTYSLEKALQFIRTQHEDNFKREGKRVAVITFTNNAADEISERVEHSPIFAISTIHSFCWSMIGGFNLDITEWYRATIPIEIEELIEQERRGRAGAASDARKQRIARLSERLEWLEEPREFTYDPNGINASQNSLSHADVLKIFSYLLSGKPLMAQIVSTKFPFLFIDESQDTDRAVVAAVLQLQDAMSDHITIGMFGDVMQRIFGSGEPELGKSIPVSWREFDKLMNHRSAKRIVGLGNQIRKEDDGRQQLAKDGTIDGKLKFFLLPADTANKEGVEAQIRETMAEHTEDQGWTDTEDQETAVLFLEHKMASRRMGFHALADALSKSTRIRGLIFQGDVSELNFFAKIVLPLAQASRDADQFELMSLLRNNKSPLLTDTNFLANPDDPLRPAREAAMELQKQLNEPEPTLLDILRLIYDRNLLTVPNKLRAFCDQLDTEEVEAAIEQAASDATGIDAEKDEEEIEADELDAWTAALSTPFWQLGGYRKYIDDDAIYRTHQGVKGNEFDRVMVIMDDDEAGGFSFSYEQYLGAKEPSKNTKEKIAAGEETGIDRTRRLFYVTSTRAKKSLAHVIYTKDIPAVRANLLDRGFASEDEIVEM